MGAIDDIYADIESEVTESEFREAVEQKVEQMEGLADEETAAMILAHELADGEVETVADIETRMDEVKFVAKVVSIGEVRTFDRDDGEGRVANVDVADETGSVRLAFWDERAVAATEELEVGDVLRIQGRPTDGYSGLEVSVDEAEPDDEAEVDVDLDGRATVESLTMGQSDVNLRGMVLGTDEVRTFQRDDGSEGRVSNLTLGDATGRIRVTLWDERADRADDLESGATVEVVDGYVREREGDLELHVGERGRVESIEESVEYEPDATAVEDLEIGRTVDIAGVVRSTDPKRTFERDDGSDGQVRNVRLQDSTGDIRVALWGEKADRDLAPGDEVLVTDAEIQDGWQDELEASAGWRSTVVVLADASAGASDDDTDTTGAGSPATDPAESTADDSEDTTGLDAFADGDSPSTGGDAPASSTGGDGEQVEFTGTVVQTGEPVVLDDGTETMPVETDASLRLGEEVTARGTVEGECLHADELL